MRVDELEIKDQDKIALKSLVTPKEIAQVAALMGIAYCSAFTKLCVWSAKGWLNKNKVGRHTRYYLNQNEVTVN